MIEAIINVSQIFERTLTNNQGNFVTGQTITYEVRNSSTDALLDSGTMTEQNEVYKFSFTFTSLIDARVKFTTPSQFPNDLESVRVIEAPANSTDVTNIIAEIDANELKIDNIDINISAHRVAVEDKIKFILGLTQHNTQIKDPVYDANGNLTSATIKLYNNATDAINDTNTFKTYTMTATFDTQDRLLTYIVSEN